MLSPRYASLSLCILVTVYSVIGMVLSVTPMQVSSQALPAQVTGLVATAVNGGISAKWKGVSGAVKYSLFVNPRPKNAQDFSWLGVPVSLITTDAKTNVLFDGVKNGFQYDRPYTVTVAAVNSAGRLGAVSQAVWVTPTDPLQVTGLKAKVSSKKITLTWKLVSGSSSYTVTVTPITPSGAPLVLTSKKSPLVIKNLVNLHTYTITVAAMGKAGLGPVSVTLTVMPADVYPGVAPAPTGVTAVAGNMKAIVSFQPPTTTGGAKITEYRVYNIAGSLVGQGPSSPITVTGLTNGVEYQFVVRAFSKPGSGYPSQVVTVTPHA